MILILMFFLCFAQGADAQNPIPFNSSFEIFTRCPDAIGQADSLIHWEVAWGTPSLFNTCASNPVVGVPANFRGWQNTSDGGQGYVGMVAISPIEDNSVLYGKLRFKPQKGAMYQFTLVLSLADESTFSVENPIQFKIQPQPFMGIAFDSIFSVSFDLNGAVDDTSGWTYLSGTWKAPDSNYVYLAMGNFKTFDAVFPGNPGGSYLGAYYYVDEISVKTVTPAARELPITPLPISPTFGSYCRISNPTGQAVNVSDITGKTVFWSQEERISFENLPEGLYLLQQVTPEGVRIGRFLRLP